MERGSQTVPESSQIRVPPAPEEPSADERARREVTHLPYQPWCAALSTKTDESAYLLALGTAFVKRMAYVRAVLKVDPERTLKLLADKIAPRASADGIQLKVETAPRFSSQSISAVGRTKTQWKVRFDV